MADSLFELVKTLAEANEILNDTDQELGRWDTAVEVKYLLATGFSVNEIRECLIQGLCELKAETTKIGAKHRKFKCVPSLMIPRRACLVITEKGLEYLGQRQASSQNNKYENFCDEQSVTTTPLEKPNWDAEKRTLTFRGEVVKEFRCRAVNQEIILASFEESEWCTKILDPLIPSKEIDPKRRLNDAIRSLNRNQRFFGISFHGDGTGRAVIWKPVEESYHLGSVEQSDDSSKPKKTPKLRVSN